MKKYILLSLLSISLFGCFFNRVSTVQDTKDWYQKYYVGQTDNHVSPLYYKGSNEKFHFYICRSMDEWVNFKIRYEELKLEEILPLLKNSFQKDTTSHPGYYAVDPLNDFKKISQ